MIIEHLYETKLDISDYNPKFYETANDVITVTVSLIDFNRNAVIGKNITLTVDKGYFKKYNGATGKSISNDTTKSITVATDSNGQVIVQYAPSESGLCTFTCNNSKIQCLVNEIEDNSLTLRQTITKNGATVKVYDDGFNVYIRYSGTVSIASKENKVIGTLDDLTYAPARYTYGILSHMQGDIRLYGTINEAGNIYIINRTTSTSIPVYGLITYPLKSRIP